MYMYVARIQYFCVNTHYRVWGREELVSFVVHVESIHLNIMYTYMYQKFCDIVTIDS